MWRFGFGPQISKLVIMLEAEWLSRCLIGARYSLAMAQYLVMQTHVHMCCPEVALMSETCHVIAQSTSKQQFLYRSHYTPFIRSASQLNKNLHTNSVSVARYLAPWNAAWLTKRSLKLFERRQASLLTHLGAVLMGLETRSESSRQHSQDGKRVRRSGF